jgi:5-methylcytosine-specific restriction protein A
MIDRRYLSQARRGEIVESQGYCCAECGEPLVPGHYEFDHTQALEHDGDNAPDNWQALCTSPCHRNKTRLDHQARAKRDRLIVGGRQRKGPPMPGSKASGLSRRFDGTVVRRT